MRETGSSKALRRLFAVSLLLGTGGGCIALGYDFDKLPPTVCAKADECPGIDTQCGTRACVQGACQWENVRPANFVPPTQIVGDCSIGRCDGEGNLVFSIDETDVPFDGNDCTDDKCVQGTPSNTPSPIGQKCGLGANTQCNGVGACIGCSVPGDCGNSTTCVTWNCNIDVCTRMLAPLGSVANDPQDGDCKADLCDANGEIKTGFYKDDPKDTGDPCKFGVCDPITGDTLPTNEPDGKLCGDCQQCVAGACSACSPSLGYECQGMACVPILDLPNGSACVNDSDCVSNFCVDGVCCESSCAGSCMGCSNATTGQPNGKCAPVTDGTDPHVDCESPPEDVCVGGACQCFNKKKDGGEVGVDCGGICTPCLGKWVCNGASDGCSLPNPECCIFNCFDCLGSAAECGMVQGSVCTVGVDPPKSFNTGVMMDASCPSTLSCGRITCVCQ